MKYHIFTQRMFLPKLRARLIPLILQNKKHNVYYASDTGHYGYVHLEISEADVMLLKLHIPNLFVSDSETDINYYRSHLYETYSIITRNG